MDTLRSENKCASDTVSVLALSLVAIEEFVAFHDAEFAKKSKLSRECQVEALQAKVKEARLATDSYRATSADNVAKLQVTIPHYNMSRLSGSVGDG